MTATVILYIGFSLYNCLEKTTQTVWKTWKTQGISFCQICKHPDIVFTGYGKKVNLPQAVLAAGPSLV